MINQDALILATAEKDNVDLDKYKQQVLKDIEGKTLFLHAFTISSVGHIILMGTLKIHKQNCQVGNCHN